MNLSIYASLYTTETHMVLTNLNIHTSEFPSAYSVQMLVRTMLWLQRFMCVCLSVDFCVVHTVGKLVVLTKSLACSYEFVALPMSL